MITIGTILTILAIILIIFILFKIYQSVRPAITEVIPEPWPNVIFWVLVLFVTVWALGYFGIMQPVIR